jgi:DNA-binding LacI/PurR family transcriptional regulator
MAKLDSVQIDSERGGELAAEHLLSLGHRDALLLGAALDRPSIRERCEGFMRVFLAGGGSFDKRKHLIKCEHTYHSGRDHALESLKRFPSTTAIFCVNDEMAAGALYAVLSLGLRVPKDVSIVGFDDVILSRYTSPGLTTIGLYKQELGRRAIQRLLTLVEAKHTESKKHDVKQEKVEVELVVRESTGPVKALPSTIAKPRARRKAKARAS